MKYDNKYLKDPIPNDTRKKKGNRIPDFVSLSISPISTYTSLGNRLNLRQLSLHYPFLSPRTTNFHLEHSS